MHLTSPTVGMIRVLHTVWLEPAKCKAVLAGVGRRLLQIGVTFALVPLLRLVTAFVNRVRAGVGSLIPVFPVHFGFGEDGLGKGVKDVRKGARPRHSQRPCFVDPRDLEVPQNFHVKRSKVVSCDGRVALISFAPMLRGRRIELEHGEGAAERETARSLIA